MNKKLFDTSKNNLELKLLLLNTLEDFDGNLATVLNEAIIAMSDKKIVELIIELRVEADEAKIISSVLSMLLKISPNLENKIIETVGKQFLGQYKN